MQSKDFAVLSVGRWPRQLKTEEEMKTTGDTHPRLIHPVVFISSSVVFITSISHTAGVNRY